MINDLIILSDFEYGRFIDKLFVANSSSNIFFDTVAIGLSTAGALVSGETLAKVLSGSSAGVQGVQSSVNERLFADKAIQALVDAMDTERAMIKKRIFVGMQQEVTVYRLSDGIRDVQSYHEAGSLIVGLTKLSESAATDKKNAQEETNKEQLRALGTAPTK